MTGERKRLDYELDDILEVRRPDQFRAVGDPTRQRIISLLSERAATTSQLAKALGQPKGSVGHHLKVLEEAGLIRVVRTRQVRAITEKYYGRTARFFEFMHGEGDLAREPTLHLLRQVMNEYVAPESEESEEWRERLLIRLACRSAIRRGKPLSPVEAKTLLDQLGQATVTSLCPHGAPVVLHFNRRFFERQFAW